MKIRIAALFAVFVIGTLAAPPVFAQSQSADQTSEAVVMEALNHLYLRYPDKFDPVELVNAAIRGMAEKIGRPDLLAPVPPATSYFDWFNSQRDLAMQVSGMKRIELEFAATKAMLDSLEDSHTYFIAPEVVREIEARRRGQEEYSGIGVRLKYRDNRIYVWDVMPGGPAERAGLRRFDRILNVDDAMVDGLPKEAAGKIANMIRGPVSTEVRLTIQRAGESQPLVIAVIRQPIVTPILTYKMLSGKIGYIHIWWFDEDAAKKFVAALRKLQADGMRALVLDLRHNPGGLVDEMEQILSAILAAEVPFLRAAAKDQSEVLYTSGKPVLDRSLPLAVLVDESSASASEITAAAIKEYRRGTVVGTKTRGAVEMSVIRGLPGGAAMSVTIARLRTGKGARLEKVGVMPTIQVELTLADIDAGRDVQLERAVKEALRKINP